MKILSYKIMGYTEVYNPDSEEVERQECLANVTVPCPTQADFDANYAIAEKEAYNGEITVEDDGEPDPAPADDDEYADMAAAIREGVNGI